jgi:hypothetical protein
MLRRVLDSEKTITMRIGIQFSGAIADLAL